MRASWPHWSSPSGWSPDHPPGVLAGPRLPLGPLGPDGWGRAGGGGRQGWRPGRTDHARGLLVSWGQRLQESSGQEKETKNNPERESPERGTGKWGAEGRLEQGNSDASLAAQAQPARLRTRRPRRPPADGAQHTHPPRTPPRPLCPPSSRRSPAPVCSEPCALSTSHSSPANGTLAHARTHTLTHARHAHTHAHHSHTCTYIAQQLDDLATGQAQCPLHFQFSCTPPSHPPHTPVSGSAPPSPAHCLLWPDSGSRRPGGEEG